MEYYQIKRKKELKLPERLKYQIRCFLSILLKPIYCRKRDTVFIKRKQKGLNDIPVFIISYNRLSYLEQFIPQLEKHGMTNIHIIDNCSTYPPLLDYYKKCPYDIIYMKKNKGHMVFWNSEEFDNYRSDFYIVSDPDLEILETCPNDFLTFFFEKLWKYPFVRKVGFSLKIDDLPLNGCISMDAIKWEKQYYRTYIKKDNLYYAGIDTTFALYVPDSLVGKKKFLSAFRAGNPYQMRHLPWYKDNNNITEEDLYYSSHKTNGWFDPVKGFRPDEIDN